jgi:polyferredoxin
VSKVIEWMHDPDNEDIFFDVSFILLILFIAVIVTTMSYFALGWWCPWVFWAFVIGLYRCVRGFKKGKNK